MLLVPNWRSVVRRAWSVKLMLLAAVLSGAEVAMPLLEHWPQVPTGLLALLSALTTTAAFIARITLQQNLRTS